MKRANDDAGSSQPAKRSRTTHTATIALMNSILANPRGYPISASEEIVRKSLVDLATYARHLEQQLVGPAAPVAGSSKAAASSKPPRSPADLAAAADKLRKAAVSGIKKQMSVSGPRASQCPAPGLTGYRIARSGSRHARPALRSGPMTASARTRRSLARL